MKTMKKLWLLVAAQSVMTLLCVIRASACTMVYVGSDLYRGRFHLHGASRGLLERL